LFAEQQINQQLLSDPVDISLDLSDQSHGHFNLLQKFRRTVEDVFMSMGFDIEYGPEVVTKYENFFSLNFRPGHPAIEMHDTIYVDKMDTQ
jgi:phenylalanyl-tRNA synthetase alpha chain